MVEAVVHLVWGLLLCHAGESRESMIRGHALRPQPLRFSVGSAQKKKNRAEKVAKRQRDRKLIWQDSVTISEIIRPGRSWIETS